MPKPPIRPGVNEALDVHRDGLAQIAFNLMILIDDLADLHDLVFAKILDPDRAVDAGLLEDLTGRPPADPEHIGQTDIRPLFPGQIDSGYACHAFPFRIVNR